MTIKRMKLSICDDTCEASSSDDDTSPILPQSASRELSPIEESQLEYGVETDSTVSSSSISSLSSSPYMSSLIDEVIESDTNLSNLTRDSPPLNDVDKYTDGWSTASDGLDNEQLYHEPNRRSESDYDEIERIEESFAIEISQERENESQTSDNSQDLRLAALTNAFNIYHDQKIFAHVLLNLALLSANANQLKYLLESYERRPLFYYSFSFIIASLVVQVLMKIILIVISRYNMCDPHQIVKAVKMSKVSILLIMLVTIVNIAISAIILLEMRGIF